MAVLGLSQALAETTDGETTRYAYGHDLLSEYDGVAWAYHVNDGLGSVRQLVDDGGQVTLAQGYTPFGVPLWDAGSATTGYGFTGEQREAYSQLLFLRARYYQPGMGRFSSKDLWEGDSYQPLTKNPYLYVLANPARWVDPTGLYLTEDGSALGCQEGCEVHDVVKFIARRIREDAAGQDIAEIYELNTTQYYEDAWVECQRMPWWQRWILCPDYLEGARNADMAARVEAVTRFGCLVADGRSRPVCGQWDYKVEIGREWKQAQAIDFCSIGYDEEVIFYYDIWANFHFAYLGMVGGFSEDALLTGAAIEHAVSNPGQFEDDPSDQACAKIGIRLYHNALSEKALLRQIYAHKDELNKARMEDGRIIEVYR